jgi:hypothetical protein
MKIEHEYLWRLRKKLQEFEKLDEILPNNIRSGNSEFILTTLEAKKEVKRVLTEKDSLNIGPDRNLAKKLRMIRDDYGYNIDIICKKLGEILGEKFSQSSEDEKDFIDALLIEGTADYIDDNFFRRRNEVGTIIGSNSLPDIFLYHLSKLKECYSLGLFEATVIYCRAVIESGCFELLKRKGRINKYAKDIREYKLRPLMNSIKEYVYPYTFSEVENVIELAGNILHSKRKTIIVSEEQALDSIKTTFAIIEDLYK